MIKRVYDVCALPFKLIGLLAVSLGDRALRRWLLTPYLLGILCSALVLLAFIFLRHTFAAPLVALLPNWLASLPSIAIVFGSVFFSGFCGYVATLLFGALFQEFLIEARFSMLGWNADDLRRSRTHPLRLIVRATIAGCVQASIVLTVTIALLLMSLVPVLNLITMALSALVLGYSHFDMVLAVRGLGFRERSRFCLSHLGELITVGIWSSLFIAVPYLPIVTLPLLLLYSTDRCHSLRENLLSA